MSRFAKIENIIADWETEFPSKDYVYRGQGQIYRSDASAVRIPSTLLRELPDNKKDCDIKELEARLVSCALANFPPHTSFFEARTEVRHLGHPTGCIDFSSDMLVALSFASDKKHRDEDGELLFLKASDAPFAPALEQDLLAAPAFPRGDTVIVEASHTEYTGYHNRLQASVLALPQKGCLILAESHTRTVTVETKKLFRDYWNYLHGSFQRLFTGPDLAAGEAAHLVQRRMPQDFPRSYEDIENLWQLHDDLLQCSDPYKRGKEHYYRGEYEQALKCFYAMANPSRPSRPTQELNQFLASSYLHLCQYQRALAQLKQLPQSTWSDVDYYMAAEGSFYLGNIAAALFNMLEARKKNPRRPIYYRALLSIAVEAGNYDWAKRAARASYYYSQNGWDFDRLRAEIARRF